VLFFFLKDVLGFLVGEVTGAGAWLEAAYGPRRSWVQLLQSRGHPASDLSLAAVLTLAGTTASLSQGVLLLTAYSLGLGVPFLVLGLSVARVRLWLRPAGRINRRATAAVGRSADRDGSAARH